MINIDARILDIIIDIRYINPITIKHINAIAINKTSNNQITNLLVDISSINILFQFIIFLFSNKFEIKYSYSKYS